LRKIFATHGIPERLESDNGPPFNSSEFTEFAEEMGFIHHRITPDHPRANGEAESFMKVLNKTEKIARSEGQPSNTAIQYMLIGYRSTPHPATRYSPYETLMKRNVRTKLDCTNQFRLTDIQKMEAEIADRDKANKKKWENQNRHPKSMQHKFKINDKVLFKNREMNKWSTPYEKEHYIVTEVLGSSIKAQRKSDGHIIYRDASKFKLLHEPNDDCWRQQLLSTPDRSRHFQPNNSIQDDRDQEPRTDGIENESEQSSSDPREVEQHLSQKREVSKRTRRLPSIFKDYILHLKKR
jgi:transposase InsO family protein